VEPTILPRISVSVPPVPHTLVYAKVVLNLPSWVIEKPIVLAPEEVGINRSGSL